MKEKWAIGENGEDSARIQGFFSFFSFFQFGYFQEEKRKKKRLIFQGESQIENILTKKLHN